MENLDASSDNSTEGSGENNWDKNNKHTLSTWKSNLIKSSYISQIVLDKTRSKLNIFLLIAFIINTLSTTLSGISALSFLTTIQDSETYKFLNFSISVVMIIFNGMNTVITSVIKLYNFDATVQSLTSYIQRIDNLLGTIASVMILEDKLKPDAIDFITKYQDSYTSIIQNAPDISVSDYKSALASYNSFITNKTAKLAYQKYTDL